MMPIALFPMLIILLVVVIPLLVLFIRLCIKKPKLIAILALVPTVLVLFFVFPTHSNRVNYEGIEHVNQRFNHQYSQSPIWSEGIEDQFEADVYPSKIAAVRSIPLKIGKQFRHVMSGPELPDTILIFDNSQEMGLVELLRDVIIKLYPDVKCRIEMGNGNVLYNSTVVTISFYFKNVRNVYSSAEREALLSGTLQATISNEGRNTNIRSDFTEKPWVENFSDFANRYTNRRYIAAKSTESCLTPGEADQQAMEDACVQVSRMLKDYPRQSEDVINMNNQANPAHIQESGMVIDKFVQSFDGSAGKIWRQAVLLDVSPEKLNQLAEKIAGVTQAGRERRLSTVGSILGLFVLITIVYIFLNAATRGYYAWSLRIVGVVLALILIFLLL